MKYDELGRRVSGFIREHHMIEEGDRVCVGCSGGADSMFLLLFLNDLRDRLPFELMACHVNHGLRGEESRQDQLFVEKWCRENGIFCRSFSFDVRETARIERTGVEEAGRLVRRRAFAACVRQNGADRIALAHHMNDQAETVLFHLARGSGLSGMAGIRPVTEGVNCTFIRPLLLAERDEIESALREKGISWRTDSTNLRDDPTRNRIRHRILPEMEETIHHGTVRHIAVLAEVAGEADDYFRGKAAGWLERFAKKEEFAAGCAEGRGECGFPGTENYAGNLLRLPYSMILLPGVLQQEEKIIRQYVIREAADRLVPGLRNLSMAHVSTVLGLFQGETGKQADLPGGIHAVSEYGDVRLYTRAEKAAPPDNSAGSARVEKDSFFREENTGDSTGKPRGCTKQENPVHREEYSPVAVSAGKGSAVFGGWRFSWELLPADRENLSSLTREQKYTKCLNYDTIKSNLEIRTRRPGDYLIIDHSGSRKKLKKYLTDEKIPAVFRDSIPLLASGEEVWWIVGGRISCAAEIDADTETVLKISAERM